MEEKVTAVEVYYPPSVDWTGIAGSVHNQGQLGNSWILPLMDSIHSSEITQLGKDWKLSMQ